jgi:predicted amidohydrolase YtcJ
MILMASRDIFSSLLQNTHCIGDYANHIILNILEKMHLTYDLQETRPRIEHAQILRVEDIQRLGHLGGKFPVL